MSNEHEVLNAFSLLNFFVVRLKISSNVHFVKSKNLVLSNELIKVELPP